MSDGVVRLSAHTGVCSEAGSRQPLRPSPLYAIRPSGRARTSAPPRSDVHTPIGCAAGGTGFCHPKRSIWGPRIHVYALQPGHSATRARVMARAWAKGERRTSGAFLMPAHSSPAAVPRRGMRAASQPMPRGQSCPLHT